MDNLEDYSDKNTVHLYTEDLESLKEKIRKDPWNQELYTVAIHLATTQNDHKSLEFLKKEFYNHCIPDDNFWLSYIDEKKQSSNRNDVLHLYELAVKNYPSSYIWLSYLRFVFENSHTSSDYVKLRQLFELSLEDLGHHSLDGPQLWSEYRHFEQELLNKVHKDEYEQQINRIRTLFYRQLQIPLAGLPDLLDEYLVWEGELPQEYKKPTKEGEEAHKRGFDAWEQRKCFELKIQCDFHDMMSRDNKNSLWNDYIDFELKSGDMARIMMVYHRALDDLGYERDDLWINYANYALQTSYTKSLTICERACRHMPRSMNIWINYFLVVSSKSKNVQDILDLLEKSTSAVQDLNHKISLHITAADCVRRVDFKDIVHCRYVLSKCASNLDPEYNSRAVYRLFTYWSKYELKLLSFNLDTEYIQVVGRVLERFKNDPFSWLYLIDTIKGLNPDSPHISNTVNHIYKGYSTLVNFNTELVPTNLHTLIMWLYELALTVLNVNDLAEEYIDYVQSSGVVEDIKRAHKVVATHSTQLARSDSSNRSDTLSLNSLVKKDRRRRKLETFSETSSDSGSYSSIIKKHYRITSGIRSPSLSIKDGDYLSKSPKLGFREYDSKSPILGYKDYSYSDDEVKSGKITLRDFETVTRATWYGGESTDPSLAPAVPPIAPMPPPCSPVLSRITSRLSNSGSCSPDLTPELRFSKGSDLPPPLVLSSGYSQLSGQETVIKLGDSMSNSEYRHNLTNQDSESLPEPMSSDTDSQVDKLQSPLMKYSNNHVPFRSVQKFPNNNNNNRNNNLGFWNITDVDLDTSLGGGHFLLSKKECVMNWLSGSSESSTVFVSGFETDQLPKLKEFFLKQTGFVEFRPARNKPCCYVEFTSKNDAGIAIESSKRHFTEYPTLSFQFSRPTKPLFEEKVVFLKVFNNKYSINKLKTVLKDFFKTYEFEVKFVRTTKFNTSLKNGQDTFEHLQYNAYKSDGEETLESLGEESTTCNEEEEGYKLVEKTKDEDNKKDKVTNDKEKDNNNNNRDNKDDGNNKNNEKVEQANNNTSNKDRKNNNDNHDNHYKYDKVGCYVEFDFENASRKVIYKLINEYGWPIIVNYEQLHFQVLPSIPMVGHTNNLNKDLGNTIDTGNSSDNRNTERVGTRGDPRNLGNTLDTGKMVSTGNSLDSSRLESFVDHSKERKNELYICNLNYSTDESRLKEYLEENLGVVKSLKICRDLQGHSKGYAFVEFIKDNVYNKLFKKSLVLDNRKLYITKSKSQLQSQSKYKSKTQYTDTLHNNQEQLHKSQKEEGNNNNGEENVNNDKETLEQENNKNEKNKDNNNNNNKLNQHDISNEDNPDTCTTNRDLQTRSQDHQYSKHREQYGKDGNKGRYKKRYKDYKNKLVETYSKLKKKIKLN